MVLPINDLWHHGTEQDWEDALKRYWSFVLPRNMAIERELDTLDLATIHAFNEREWYEWLHDKYFPWKYTDAFLCTIHRNRFVRHFNLSELEKLNDIRLRLLDLDQTNIEEALETAKEIIGLGVAAASGLIAVMYPHAFGTCDQFVVKALRQVDGLPEAYEIAKMKPKGLKTKDGFVLIPIMRRKALELNEKFQTNKWTPRKLDMILWTYGRD